MRIYHLDDDDQFSEYKEKDFKVEHYEENLEAWLESNPNAIVEDGHLLLIGRQVSTNLGKVIDLLGIDREGHVAIIELKRDRTPRETVAQALEYAAFAADLDYDQLDAIYQVYAGDEGITLSEQHKMFFELAEEEAVSFNKDQRIVIIGQEITPQIRQTAGYLRKKDIRVTCLEFKYFESHPNDRLFSIDIVIGREPLRPTSIITGKRSRTDKPTFLASSTATALPVYERLLALAEEQDLPVHWGVKGFSLNADVEGRHVVLCYCHPESVYRGAMYTGFDRVLEYVESGQDLVDTFRQRLESVGFVSIGKHGEVKHPLDMPLSAQEVNNIVEVISEFATEVLKHGLKYDE